MSNNNARDYASGVFLTAYARINLSNSIATKDGLTLFDGSDSHLTCPATRTIDGDRCAGNNLGMGSP